MPLYENLDLLLHDIPGPLPQGQDLKYSAEYDQIKEASREDMDLPQGVWVQDLKSANWEDVEKVCIEVLQKKSKDLQVASWLIEAWIDLYNMEGLTQGLNLLLQLSEKYWDTAFPTLNPKDTEFRCAPYNWINEKLSTRFSKVEVTSPDSKDLFTYSYATYIDLQKDGGVSITGSPDEESPVEKREGFEKSLNHTPDDFFKQLNTTGQQALEYLKKLQTFLDSKLVENSPSLYHAVEKIEEIIAFGNQVLASRITTKEAPAATEVTSTDPLNSLEQSDQAYTKGASINSRNEAYDLINKAADYLEKLDPQSPSPYLLRRAIRWGQLNLKDLLQEMIRDPGSLEDLKHLLGMTAEEIAAAEGSSGDIQQS